MAGQRTTQHSGQRGRASTCVSVEERIVMFTLFMRYGAWVGAPVKTIGRVT